MAINEFTSSSEDISSRQKSLDQMAVNNFTLSMKLLVVGKIIGPNGFKEIYSGEGKGRYYK